MEADSSSRETRMEGPFESIGGAMNDEQRSDATSAPSVDLATLAPARAVLRDWTLRRYLAVKPQAPPVVLTADTTVGEALEARGFACAVAA